MAVLDVNEVLSTWTPQQKQAMLAALVRDLLPAVTPTADERQADADELAQRHASRDQAVSVEQFLAERKEKASNRAQ